MKRAVICIATYKRDEGLSRLLDDLKAQVIPSSWMIETRVVNNDPDLNACDWLHTMSSTYPWVRALTDPRRNIAHARNTAINAGPADAFLFIDDDERPVAGWLRALLSRFEDADAAFGPVVGRVPNDTPHWLQATGMFDKPGPDHAGRIDWKQTRTSSTMVRAEWFRSGQTWFDPDYGISGGSDAEFFRRIESAGAIFVAEPRALVYEDIDGNRCSMRAVLARRYRAGAVYGRIDHARTQSRRVTRLCRQLAGATAHSVLGLPNLILGRPGIVCQALCRFAVAFGAWRGFNDSFRVVRYPSRTN